MNKKRVLLITFTILIPAVAWMFTGGIIIYRKQYISPRFFEQGNCTPLIIVDIVQDMKNYGIPFLFQYKTDYVPFSIQLHYISHKAPAKSTLCFEHVQVTYSDENQVDLTRSIPDNILMTPYSHVYIDDEGNRQETLAVDAKLDFEHCIDLRQKFSLHLSGNVKTENKIVESFNTTLKFESKTESKIFTGWSFYLISNYGG